MIRAVPIEVDDNLKEIVEHGTRAFPVAMYSQSAADRGIVNMRHWHYEWQIALSVKGRVSFDTDSGEYDIREGEGLFLGSGVIHEVTKDSDPDSEYICVIFDPFMLAEDRGDAIGKSYIDPVMSSDIRVIELRDEQWQKEILDMVRRLEDLDNRHEYGYEIDMKVCLLQILGLMIRNIRDEIGENTASTFSDRLKIRNIKRYIHDNYTDRITLADIAAAGGISRGECCRLFRRTENTTPIGYLNDHRLNQSRKLILSTDLSIGEIAYMCGYESTSYFIACFRKKYSKTPAAYRNGRPGENNT